MVESRLRAIEQPFCGSRGRLHPHRRHRVDHRIVAVVPDTAYHRQRKLRYVGSKVIVVERIQIARRAATTDYHHTVEKIGIVVDALQSGDDRRHRALPLHHRREKTRVELDARRVVVKLIHKIAISSSASGRNHSDTLSDVGPRQLLVHINYALAPQPVEYLQALTGHVAERISGIDAGYHHRQPVLLMEIGTNLNHHIHSRRKRLPRGSLKLTTQTGIHTRPDNSTQTGKRLPRLCILLHQLKIAVTAALTHVACLSHNPAPLHRRIMQQAADAPIELHQ